MKIMTARQIKDMAVSLGADLCGIAPVERFIEAPEGFRPKDLFTDVKSVVRWQRDYRKAPFPPQAMFLYVAADTVLQEVFRITCELALSLQDKGIIAVPIPANRMSTGILRPKKGRVSCPSNMLATWLGWRDGKEHPAHQ